MQLSLTQHGLDILQQEIEHITQLVTELTAESTQRKTTEQELRDLFEKQHAEVNALKARITSIEKDTQETSARLSQAECTGADAKPQVSCRLYIRARTGFGNLLMIMTFADRDSLLASRETVS